jgi:catechol 2,3-dioxygenase-like lactoylglutathione lyase family enzyme
MVRAQYEEVRTKICAAVGAGKAKLRRGALKSRIAASSEVFAILLAVPLVTKRPRPIPTFGLTHLALGVSDVERAFAFYEAVFGMVATYRSDEFLQAETPGMRDILVFEKQAGVTGATADIAHFGFRVKKPADLKDAAAVVRAAGGTIVEEGEFVPGEPYLFARDLDGYLFEIWYELR